MAALLRGLRAGRALRGLGSGMVMSHCCRVQRGLHQAALLRLQDGSKSDQLTTTASPSSSPTHQQHFQASEKEVSVPVQETPTSVPNVPESPPLAPELESGEESEGEYETEEQLQQRILTAALDFVPQYGWSVEAISAGAQTLGLSSAAAGMFINGAGDLILHFIAHILLLPHNIPNSLKHLSTMIDDIWYYAGDRSTDMNWYTRRAALTGVYNTSELVMLQDSSPDFQDTWIFLDKRIQDIIKMADTATQLTNLAGMNQRR
ncbi:hypothetical protein JZ751_027066 [Albula glossodonta]|uniref:Ubiquinone biosynthesis protein n=1 Tax=Albula glossodonta TaxID=121402 RepID=A0A8T2NCK8_9TELE|nr:hypothetical protein JZ751_027066 [Albula glossodonta]